MFAITTFNDVITIAETFGAAALTHAISNRTLTQDQTTLIHDCYAWAVRTDIMIESVNDGNIEYEVNALFFSENVAGVMITPLDNILIIREGFGAYRVNVREAMDRNYITKQNLEAILKVIERRNKACKAFGFM